MWFTLVLVGLALVWPAWSSGPCAAQGTSASYLTLGGGCLLGAAVFVALPVMFAQLVHGGSDGRHR